MASKTFRLFKALPGFLLSIASVLDLGATHYNYPRNKSPELADYNALSSDWEKTGEDLAKGIEVYKRKYGY